MDAGRSCRKLLNYLFRSDGGLNSETYREDREKGLDFKFFRGEIQHGFFYSLRKKSKRENRFLMF